MVSFSLSSYSLTYTGLGYFSEVTVQYIGLLQAVITIRKPHVKGKVWFATSGNKLKGTDRPA
jgi:hypothetical protein